MNACRRNNSKRGAWNLSVHRRCTTCTRLRGRDTAMAAASCGCSRGHLLTKRSRELQPLRRSNCRLTQRAGRRGGRSHRGASLQLLHVPRLHWHWQLHMAVRWRQLKGVRGGQKLQRRLRRACCSWHTS